MKSVVKWAALGGVLYLLYREKDQILSALGTQAAVGAGAPPPTAPGGGQWVSVQPFPAQPGGVVGNPYPVAAPAVVPTPAPPFTNPPAAPAPPPPVAYRPPPPAPVTGNNTPAPTIEAIDWSNEANLRLAMTDRTVAARCPVRLNADGWNYYLQAATGRQYDIEGIYDPSDPARGPVMYALEFLDRRRDIYGLSGVVLAMTGGQRRRR